MRTRSTIALLIALALLGGLPVSPASALPREDADHYEYYFTSYDGVNKLHADVLRPKGVPMDVPQPVILTVSPYTNHAPESFGDEDGTGPAPRFYDFLDLSGALSQGYTYAIVDLPGDGGSAGCNDWGGAREQAAVAAAVEWIADQPWSNGKVGLLGKSYDGWTGLMGVAQQPDGLAAVAALEPVYSGYRYIYMNGIRRTNWPYGQSFTNYDMQTGRPGETEYNVNSAPQVWCYPVNIAGQNLDFSETGPYWAERNLVPTSQGKSTPVFLTQGFLETNTKWDGAAQYFNGLTGGESRVWYGQFDHARAWEKNVPGSTPGGDGTRWQAGRTDFMEQLMRFFDEHLKGIKPAVEDPVVEVQDILGRWRTEETWPPKDVATYETTLRQGSYLDNGSGHGRTPSATQGLWNISNPLEHELWLSGEPVVSVSVDALPNANLAANVYDVAPDGTLFMVSRGVQSLTGTGVRNFTFTMYGQDWPIQPGHRIAVLISPANTDEFRYDNTSTRQAVTIRYATIDLPFLTNQRTDFLEGSMTTPRLDTYLNPSGKTVLTPEQLEAGTIDFNLPGPLVNPEEIPAV